MSRASRVDLPERVAPVISQCGTRRRFITHAPPDSITDEC